MSSTKTFTVTSWMVVTDTGAWIVGFSDRERAHKRARHRRANRVIRVDTTRTWIHCEDPDVTLETVYTVRTYEPTEPAAAFR